MARIIKQPNGGKYIQFEGIDGKKRSLRLGKVPTPVAEQVRVKVDRMLACLSLALPFDSEIEHWVRSLSDDMAERFAACGLIAKRQDNHLGRFLDAFVQSRGDTKKSTRDNMQVMVDRLKEYFRPDRQMHTITHAEALDFTAWLKKKYAASTAHRTLGRCRQAFREAIRRDLLTKNPFEGIKVSSAPKAGRKRFITRTEASAILEACPDARWRLIFALCRYAGFRCPSEHLSLTWGDVDWQRSRIRISSPKTGERWCPLFPELRPHLEAMFEQAEAGTVHVFDKTIHNRTNLRTHFSRIVRKAGITVWPKLFHNLRATCETELAEKYPIHVVCTWLGNSSAIANKHYLQTTDHHFAAASDAKSDAKSASLSVQSGLAGSGTDEQTGSDKKQKPQQKQGFLQEYTVTSETVQVPFSSPGSTGTTAETSGESTDLS